MDVIVTAIEGALVNAQTEILSAGVAAVGISVVLLGGKKAFGYFRGLWKA